MRNIDYESCINFFIQKAVYVKLYKTIEEWILKSNFESGDWEFEEWGLTKF